MDKTLDLDELERVAQAAGDAEWEVVDYEGGSLVIHADRENRVCFMATPGDSPGQMARIEARAVHIATFDPPTILSLIAAARPAGINTPDMPGQFEGDIWFGDPVKRNLGTHRWENGEWVLLPSELESVLELLAVRTAQRDAALSAARPAVVSDEVVEVTDRKSQWMLENSEGRWLHNAEDGTFTSDPNLGLKWPNRTAADAFRLSLRGPFWALKLTEHVWIEPESYDWTDAEDDIADAISDSMDMDWSSRDGARAVVAYLKQIGAKLP